MPETLRPNFVRMGDVAEKMVITAGQTLNDRTSKARKSYEPATRRWTSFGVPNSA